MSELRGKTLGILLATGPESSNRYFVEQIASAALELGIRVRIFLMDDGIYLLNDEGFTRLVNSGAEISVCSMNAEKRNIKNREGIIFGSQYDNADIVSKSDRFLGFFR